MALNLRIDPDRDKALEKTSAEEGVSKHEVILRAIDAYTSRRQQKLNDAINRIAKEDAELLKRLAQ